MKHKRTDAFVFRREYYEYFKTLPDDDFRFCMMVLCNYAFDCIPIPRHENPDINAHLMKFAERVDEDIYRYQKRCGYGE